MSITPATSQIFVVGPRDLRTRRPSRTIAGLVLMGLALTFGIQRVVMAAPFGDSEYGALRVRGVQANGRVFPSSSDVIRISGAYPGMAAQTSTFEVRNMGMVRVAFAVNVAGLVATGRRSLADVLRITVRDRATGRTVYRGSLAGLRIEHSEALAAGTAARFTVEVTWPSTADDDAYRGASLGFSMIARPLAP